MAVTEQTQDTECMQQIRKELYHAQEANDVLKSGRLKAWLRVDELNHEVYMLKLALERTSRKSKGRLKSIRGLEQALRTERLRHGYIVPEDMSYDQRDKMLADIATFKVAAETVQQGVRESREPDSE